MPDERGDRLEGLKSLGDSLFSLDSVIGEMARCSVMPPKVRGEGPGEGEGEGVQRLSSGWGRNSSSLGRLTASSTLQTSHSVNPREILLKKTTHTVLVSTPTSPSLSPPECW